MTDASSAPTPDPGPAGGAEGAPATAAGGAPAGGEGQPVLRPGAGAPLVPGPPRSVRAPIRAGRLNATLGTMQALYILGVIAVVLGVIVLIIHLLHR